VYLADLLTRERGLGEKADAAQKKAYRALMEQRRAEARRILVVGLQYVPKSISIRAAIASLDVMAGRSKEAEEILLPLVREFDAVYSQAPEKLDKLRPYMVPIRIYSLTAYNLGRPDEALKYGMMLWTIDPTDVANANNMAWILATEKKDFGQAMEIIQRCLRLVPNHPQVLDTAGWVLFLANKPEDAADYLKASIKYGDNAEARYHLGRVHEARGDWAPAREEYEEALKMGLTDKDKADAEDHLGKLAVPPK
jgi:tetratricopeptide (TPR) repeat protein